MQTEDYAKNVKNIEFSLSEQLGGARVSICNEDGMIVVNTEKFSNEKAMKYSISEDLYNRFLERLFIRCKVMEYPKEFTSIFDISDGLYWKLKIEFVDGTEKKSKGYEVFPYNWYFLLKTFIMIDGNLNSYWFFYESFRERKKRKYIAPIVKKHQCQNSLSLEEFKNLSKDEFNKFKELHKEKFKELMGEVIAEAAVKYHGRVFEVGCVFFVLTGDEIFEMLGAIEHGRRCIFGEEVRENIDGKSAPARINTFLGEITRGPTADEIGELNKLMREYDFTCFLFSDISDYPEDWDSEDIAEYADANDNYLTEEVNIVLALQKAVKERTIPFNSVNEIYDVMRKDTLNPNELYYECDGVFINVYDDIEYRGERRGEYEDIDDYEWLKMLSHLDDYEVSPNAIHDNIECRGEYDDVDGYEWLEMLRRLRDFEISINAVYDNIKYSVEHEDVDDYEQLKIELP